MKKLLAFLLTATLVVTTALATGYNSDTFSQQYRYNSGVVMAKYFSHDTAAVAHATNDVIVLTYIPPSSRIIGGTITVSAMGGAQTFDLGLKGYDNSGYIDRGTTTADDPDLFLDGTACSNEVTTTFANQENGDSNANYIGNTRGTYLYITALSAAWTTNETISGVIYYMEN